MNLSSKSLLNICIIFIYHLSQAHLINCFLSESIEKYNNTAFIHEDIDTTTSLKNSTILSQADVNNTNSNLFLAHHLQDNDNPNCTIRFRPETNFNYFEVQQVEPNVYVLPYEKGEISNPYQGSEKYLEEIFKDHSRVPPYVRIECVSTYPTRFKFDGVEALQFLRVWHSREIAVDTDDGEEKILRKIGVEVLLPYNATGNYIIYSPENPARATSYFIFSEKEQAPYLLGQKRLIEGYYNESHIVIPCISSKYGQHVKLFTKLSDGAYQQTGDSTMNNLEGKYYPTVGFVLSIEYFHLPSPINEYRCETNDPDDYIYVFVSSSQQPTEELFSEDLSLSVFNNSGDNNPTKGISSFCQGPPGSNVQLTKFDAGHDEGFALMKCIIEIGHPCGSSFHKRLDGDFVQNTSSLTNLPETGFLICKSDRGDVKHAFYFTGLDGDIYTEPWSSVPTTSMLRFTIKTLYTDEDLTNVDEFKGGERVRIYCDAVSDISQPRFIYAKQRNNGKKILLGEIDANKGSSFIYHVLQSSWESIICDAQPWDSTKSISITKPMNIKYSPCKSDDYFQCGDERCVEKLDICTGRLLESSPCWDGSHITFNCSTYLTNGCPGSDPKTYWQCKNGRCIYTRFRCDGDNDCGDGSDQETQLCTPVSPVQKTNYNSILNEEEHLICKVWYKSTSWTNPTVVTWNLNNVEVQSNTRKTEPREIIHENIDYIEMNSILVIPNVTLNEEMMIYNCTASNSYGSVSRLFRLKVHDESNDINNLNCQQKPQSPVKPTRPPNMVIPVDDQHHQQQKFQCTTQGKYPDTHNCRIFHECIVVEDGTSYNHAVRQQGYLDYVFTCGIGTVYCEESQVCDYERNCPCRK